MSFQHGHDNPAALGLQETCIYLARDGAMQSYAKTDASIRSAVKNPEMDGRVLALAHVNEPSDVHYPTWEMHPEGDELLVIASGSMSVEFRDGDTKRIVPLTPEAAFIVPTGVWHRLIVHEPSVLIAITPRHNTVHQKDPATRVSE